MNKKKKREREIRSLRLAAKRKGCVSWDLSYFFISKTNKQI